MHIHVAFELQIASTFWTPFEFRNYIVLQWYSVLLTKLTFVDVGVAVGSGEPVGTDTGDVAGVCGFTPRAWWTRVRGQLAEIHHCAPETCKLWKKHCEQSNISMAHSGGMLNLLITRSAHSQWIRVCQISSFYTSEFFHIFLKCIIRIWSGPITKISSVAPYPCILATPTILKL